MKDETLSTKSDSSFILPPSSLEKPTWVRYQVLAAGCLLALLTYVQRLGFARALPDIKRDIGLNDDHIGDLTAAFLIAYGGFQVFGGLAGDRLGARHLLTLLVLGWSLLTGAVALTMSLPDLLALQFGFLLVLRFLFGMLQAGGFPTWARVLADWMPLKERGFAQGLVWTFTRLGGAASPFIFTSLLVLFGTWTTPFWVIAALGLLWCAGFWPWFRNRPDEMSFVNAAERELIDSGRPARDPTPASVPWSGMLRSRSVWGLCLMYGFVGFSGNFVTSFLPVYLKDHCHLTNNETDWGFGLTLAAGMLSCVLGGLASDWLIRRTGNRKWGRRITGMIGVTLAGLAFLVAPWVDGVVMLTLVFGVVFFGNDLIMGPAWAACADVGERHAGTLSGAMNMTGSFVGAAGMALAGRLLTMHEYGLLFGIFACSYAAAALSWLAVDVTKPLGQRT
jgi:MFS transporter, ACS family, glucarate transporter